MTSRDLRNVYLRLAGVVMLALVLALAANAYLSHRIFERALGPEMAKKVAVVGGSIRVLLLRAVDSGIAFDQLHGVEDKFAEVAAELPELSYLAITDPLGRVLYQRPTTMPDVARHLASPAVLGALSAPGQSVGPVRVGAHDVVSLPVVSAAGPLGMLHLGVDVRFVDGLMMEMLLDVLVVLVVSLFVTLELLHFMAGARVQQALGTPDRPGQPASAIGSSDVELAKVRAPLFVFILAEELTRSFLPGYAQDLMVPIAGLSPHLVLSLPIALFMLVVALGQPYFGVLSDRWGTRRTMLLGAGVAAAGFFASALAVSVLDLLLWRSLCAVGYAMVFVAAQGHVLAHSTARNRAAGFATFVGAIMVATVCGPSIGGILADNLGERPTFAVAGVLALLSLAFIRHLPSRPPAGPVPGSAPRVPRWPDVAALLANRRFLTVTALAAMPAKILLTGLCFYLVPLYVTSSGGTQAMAGRVLMTYGVMVVLLSPLAAGWARTRERMEALVGGGLLLSGLGGLTLLAGDSIEHVFVAVVLVGIGQAMSISAQSALVSEHCAASIAALGEGAVFGVYRLLERLGNAAGPLLAAALVMTHGYRSGFIALGGFVCLCGLAFIALTRRRANALPVPA